MARNPDWSRDELLLALDLYLTEGMLDDTDEKVLELSTVLGQLPVHPPEVRTSTFRNPNGVARKLSNLANYDPGYDGKPTRGGQLDEIVWQDWADRPEELREVAEAIRSTASGDKVIALPDHDAEDVEAPEGKLLYRRHRARERSQKLRQRKIKAVTDEGGKIECEVCRFDFAATYGALGDGYIECHHLVPLHEVGETTTKLSDLALVCSNCHRMIHRRSPWPSPDDLRSLLNPPGPAH